MGKAIILVAFGSTNVRGIENSIGILEKDLKDTFGDEYTILTAFTSKKILRVLKEKNIVIPHITKALFNLGNDGYEEVIIQPLHMLKGKDNSELEEIINEYSYSFKKLILGNSLLGYEGEELIKESYRMAEAMSSNLGDKPILLAGHGSKATSNEPYHILKKSLSNLSGKKLYMATLEGDKTFEHAVDDLKLDKVKDLVIKPLFIIPGKHVFSDIAEGNESWINRLKVSGIDAEISNYSLLEYENIRNMYIDNIKKMIMNT